MVSAYIHGLQSVRRRVSDMSTVTALRLPCKFRLRSYNTYPHLMKYSLKLNMNLHSTTVNQTTCAHPAAPPPYVQFRRKKEKIDDVTLAEGPDHRRGVEHTLFSSANLRTEYKNSIKFDVFDYETLNRSHGPGRLKWHAQPPKNNQISACG